MSTAEVGEEVYDVAYSDYTDSTSVAKYVDANGVA